VPVQASMLELPGLQRHPGRLELRRRTI